MIEIVKGNSIQTHSYCIEKYTDQTASLLLIGDEHFALPYTIIRLLIPQYRALIGDEELNRVLEKHKLVTSLFFSYLTPLLTEQEKREQSIICARLSSNISHNRIAKTTLNETCVALLMELSKGKSVRIVIPDVRYLDVGSIDVLKLLHKVHPQHAPDLVLGFNPNWGKEEVDYENGLVYYASVDALINIQAFAYSFEATADKVHDLSNEQLSIEHTPIKNTIDPTDEAQELKAYELLLPENYIASSKNHQLILSAIWGAFKLYDFTMALRLAHSFLEYTPDISDKDKGELYHIIGLSAHNRQFFSQGNENLGRFLERMFTSSLTYEKNPENRIGAIYRLIVTLSRRLNRHEEAMEFVNFALSELDSNSFDPAHHALLKGWIFNINSFVLMRVQRINDAIQFHEDAFDLLKNVTSPIEHLNKEIRFTQAVLAENLTTLCSLLNDRSKMEYWCKIEESYSKEWPGLSAVPFAEWQSFYYKGFELKKALENAQKGVDKAADNFEYILEYFFTMSLSDIHIRLGNYEEALKYFKKSLLFQSQIAYDFTSALSLRIGVALSLIGLNKLNEADDFTQQMLSDYRDSSLFSLIEIHLVKAFVFAHLKNSESAESAINTAIDLAVETGNFDVLVHTACKAGELCQLMERSEDALNAYSQAKEIMESQSDETNASNNVLLNLGLFEQNQTDPSLLINVIKNFPQALKTNYAIWSQLNRFLTSYLQVISAATEGLFTSCANELAIILKVAAQRNDCRENLLLLEQKNAQSTSDKPLSNTL